MTRAPKEARCRRCRVASVLSVWTNADGGQQAGTADPDCGDLSSVQAGSAGIGTSMNGAEISPWRGLSTLSPDRWCQEALGVAPGCRRLRRPIGIDRVDESPTDVRVTERTAWGWILWEIDIPGLMYARAEGGDLARTARRAVRLREIIVRHPGLDSMIVQAQASAAADPLQVYARGQTQDLGKFWSGAAAGIAGGLTTSALPSPWPLVDAALAAAAGTASWVWWKHRAISTFDGCPLPRWTPMRGALRIRRSRHGQPLRTTLTCPRSAPSPRRPPSSSSGSPSTRIRWSTRARFCRTLTHCARRSRLRSWPVG